MEEGSKERRREEMGEEGRENYRQINNRKGGTIRLCSSSVCLCKTWGTFDSSMTSVNLAGSSSLSPR